MKLSAEQQIKFDIISQYLSGRINYKDAIVILRIKERQFRRIVKDFREKGLESLLHGNYSREPVNKTQNSLMNKIVKLYKGRYQGMNVAHFREKLIECEKMENVPCYSTLRNFLLKEKVISPVKKRTKRAHPRRKRYEREGVMVQIDGSHHRWITGKLPSCLTLAIDDATGKLLAGTFTKTETTFAAMDVVEQIIKEKGIFQLLYSDRAGIYGGGKRQGYSNMNRVMNQLGIHCLQASTPQAKGRIERVFRTLQSRLIAEMRLANVTDLDSANRFLKEKFIPDFNRRFSVLANNQIPAYKNLPEEINLTDIFCMIDDRVVHSGEVINYGGKKYVLINKNKQSLEKKMIEIRLYRDDQIKFFYQDEEIEFEFLDSDQKQAA
jgi:hypothetical protein